MNGRQRILAALAGRPWDSVPVMLHDFMMAARESGVSMARFRRDGKAVAASFIRAVETYGTDGVLVDIDTAMLAGAVGVPVDFPDDLPARAAAPLLDSLEAVEDLPPPDIRSYFEIEAALEAVSILRDHFEGEIAIRGNCDQCPFSLAGLVRGLENWMMDLAVGDKRLVRRLLEWCAEATRQFLYLMAASGADVLSNGDSPAGPSMISPAMYRDLAQPSEKGIVDLAHELGKPYVLHICGDTGPILADMAATGADGLEVDFKTDTRLARGILGGRTAFLGNIDPSGVLALGTPKLVEERTRELLTIFAGEPRFILNAGCAIPAETPPENIRTLVRTARAFRP